MSGRWWRAYDEAVDDPKLILLSERQHRAWFGLMCIASANGGVLPDIKVIAVKLRVTPAKASAVLIELENAGLFDRDGNGQVTPHNWAGRQFQSDVSTTRVKRFRQRQGNVSPPVSETPPETEAETETESSSLRSEGSRAPRWPFDRFWQLFPNKVGRQDAEKAFIRVERAGAVAFDELIAALERYVAKTDDRPWCNPSTWLNQGRWTDQPATVPRRNGDGKRSIHDAASDLVERVRALGDPVLIGGSEPAGQAAVRLLPAGRRE